MTTFGFIGLEDLADERVVEFVEQQARTHQCRFAAYAGCYDAMCPVAIRLVQKDLRNHGRVDHE